MRLRSKLSLAVGVVWLGLSVGSGCGGPSVDTGPVEEPNVGPGGPPGVSAKGTIGTGKTAPGPSAKEPSKK